MSSRTRMKSLAEDVVGLGAGDPGPYLDLIGADESEAMRAAMLSMSGCGLTVRGLWRRYGLKDARLEAPYQPGQVIADLVAMAKEADAWHEGASGLPELNEGDVVYVSEPDHVGTIVRAERPGDGSVHVTTVDGGSQDAAGRQLIVKWDRAFAVDGDVTAGPMAGQGRVVRGTIEFPRVATHFGAGDAGDLDFVKDGLLLLGGLWLLRRLWKRVRG